MESLSIKEKVSQLIKENGISLARIIVEEKLLEANKNSDRAERVFWRHAMDVFEEVAENH